MSFGTGGGFGSGSGFGQQNTQQPSAFGGFGTNTNTNTGGFGASGSGFGTTTNTAAPAGGMFGASGGSGFGSTTSAFGGGGGFGAAKPAFGSTTTTTGGGGLFGASTSTPATNTAFGGGGGFGTNTANTGGAFGTANTSLFGGAKPATSTFSGTTAGGFGGGSTSSLFGGGNTAATGFGATNNPGIGTNIGDPPGTGGVAFTATVEKETNNPSQSNSYQNILFMDAYKKWSAEELRLADYNQGRKMGVAGGGTGNFGSTGFGTTSGGFGTNTQTNTGGFGAQAAGGSLFGSTPAGTTNAFGATNTNTGGFGSTGGGLFGQAKPAASGGSLFGSTTAQPAQGGGLFGNSGTTGGFGAANNTATGGFGTTANNTGGGGLFGSTAATAQKPATGFGFNNTSGTTNAFGTNTGTTNVFGTTNTTPAVGGGGLFGSTTQNTTGGGLFGNPQQQQQQPAATGFGTAGGFGAQAQNTGTGLFGSQPKPAGFGTTTTGNTGSGLFGNTTQTTTSFGGATANQPATGGGLFGKPAGTGGLFGATTNNQAGTTGTGGLFGSLGQPTQNQQPAQNSLFGQTNSQAKPGLFGAQQATGGGLFGNSTGQANTGGLFGNTNTQQQQQQQQQQPGGFGNSLLGGSQNQQPQQQAFSTSINDLSAYGSTTLFSNLPDDKISNPGPLATPLSGKSKVKSRSILPMYKLSPANASRFATPQKRGFGFSYSTYGSPSSPSSVASTPGGLGQSLLVGGSLSRSLGKSISASNLRRSFNVEDSILAPGAFSASSGPRLLGSSTTHKKLVINRDLRSDLFTSPNKEKTQDVNGNRKQVQKRVSFETSSADVTENGTRDARESPENSPTTNEDLGYLKPAIRGSSNGANGSRSSSVTATPEMEQVKGKELAIVHEEASPEAVRSRAKPGSSIEAGSYWMSPSVEEIRAMNRVQRQKVANFVVGRENVGSVAFKVPVDLTAVDFENLYDNIVVLEPRSATVYPIAAKKPPVGKGLNVPALISLEHSYPRGGLATSGRRLERHIERLKNAIADTTFENYDKETGVWTFSVEHFTTYGLDDDDDEDDDDVTDAEPITVQHPASSATKGNITSPEVVPDDTFEFKRSRRAVPGAFDEGAMVDDEELSDNAQPQGMSSPEPEEPDSPVNPQDWREDESMVDEQDVYQHETLEQESQHGSIDGEDNLTLARFANDNQVPAGIMRARMRAMKKSTAPTRIEVAGGDDWTQILQASVKAPRTMDRATLRALNESGAVWEMKDRGSPAPQKPQHVPDGNGFATSIDLMKSLFDQAKAPTQPVQAAPSRGFVKWPYQKRAKVDTEENVPAPRPTWGPDEHLITTHNNETNILPVDGDVPGSGATNKQISQLQHYINSASATGGVQESPSLRELARGDSVWELAGLLFDDNGANLTAFWKQMVSDATDDALLRADTAEEKAIVCLAGNRVPDACSHLIDARDFRLANLVATIGAPTKDIRAQLNDWRESNVLAEFSEPIRAIYELLGGNACVCAGVKNTPIENRVASFTISQRFGLDWMQSFGLRLFYASQADATEPLVATGWPTGVAEAAVRSFQADIEQDREPEPNHPLWSLLKIFAFRTFDWADPRLGWLLTKAIYATGKVPFGGDAAEKLDMASVGFASALTTTESPQDRKMMWVQAAFVLMHLSEEASREAAVRDHLGRHAHLIGSNKDEKSAFSALKKFGVPEAWIWEAKALHFRSREDARQEFLALVWAGNYKEANRAFVSRVAPELVIKRDSKKLFTFAELLYKVKDINTKGGFDQSEWERGGAAVYLLYPLAIANIGERNKKGSLLDDEKLGNQLLDGLVALRAQTHGDIKQEAAIADMAEELIKRFGSGGGVGAARSSGQQDDQRLYGLLPEDVRGKYLRARALESVC
ncbi:nuclear protein 96-domain-containing protein [Apodospora peruviana]|uniref:Nuclear protein 96-domain-containing protein n=1 Tax=Apodospora peruviana TaxID=516989 RepID=A0AAE0M267_9PEZI|nr:nuclear protein 96-domain-containing protein [Apodospora peruviana]